MVVTTSCRQRCLEAVRSESQSATLAIHHVSQCLTFSTMPTSSNHHCSTTITTTTPTPTWLKKLFRWISTTIVTQSIKSIQMARCRLTLPRKLRRVCQIIRPQAHRLTDPSSLRQVHQTRGGTDLVETEGCLAQSHTDGEAAVSTYLPMVHTSIVYL
jgi:hypothetical protein